MKEVEVVKGEPHLRVYFVDFGNESWCAAGKVRTIELAATNFCP